MGWFYTVLWFGFVALLSLEGHSKVDFELMQVHLMRAPLYRLYFWEPGCLGPMPDSRRPGSWMGKNLPRSEKWIKVIISQVSGQSGIENAYLFYWKFSSLLILMSLEICWLPVGYINSIRKIWRKTGEIVKQVRYLTCTPQISVPSLALSPFRSDPWT